MVAPVEVGEGGLGLLVGNGLLKEHQTRDRKVVGEACLAALKQWAVGQQAQTVIETWLKQYNHIRPHQALNMRTPVPETLSGSGT